MTSFPVHFRYTRLQQIVAIVLLGVLFIGTGIGLRDPWPSDEPRFAMMARDMVETGQWLFPMRGEELYPDKPPIFMWAQAAIYQLTDSLRVATLLPSLLSGLLVLLLIYDIGGRMFRRRIGAVAAIALLAMPQFVLEARAGQLDAMVTAWIAVGMYGFLRYLLVDQHRGWLLTGFAACGFGIITKGVGFLPLLVFLAAWIAGRKNPDVSRVSWSNWLTGGAILLAAIAVWLVPMLVTVELSNDPQLEAYRNNILWQQTAERYATPSHHFKPAWYFFTEVIPSLWLPLFVLLPWVIPAWWRRIRRGDMRYRALLLWVGMVILFFSISPAKRGVYILPALPWATLALAPLLPGLLRKLSVQWMVTIGLIIIAAIGLSGAIYLQWFDPQKAAEILAKYNVSAKTLCLLAWVGASVSALIAYSKRPGTAWLAMMLSAWTVLGIYIYPRLNHFKSGAELLAKVETFLEDDQPLALVKWREQTLLQAQRPAKTFGFSVPAEEQWTQAIAWLRSNPEGAILSQAVDPRCADSAHITPMGIAHRREWFLVEALPGLPICDSHTPAG